MATQIVLNYSTPWGVQNKNALLAKVNAIQVPDIMAVYGLPIMSVDASIDDPGETVVKKVTLAVTSFADTIFPGDELKKSATTGLFVMFLRAQLPGFFTAAVPIVS